MDEQPPQKNTALIIGSVIIAAVVITAGYFYVTKNIPKNGLKESSTPQSQAPNADRMRNLSDTMKNSITEAVEKGTLTQRQGELLLAEFDMRDIQRGAQMPPTTSGTPQAFNTTEMMQKSVDALNEKGLSTTVEELTLAQAAAEDAGITMLGARGPGGPRNGDQFPSGTPVAE